MRVFGCLLVAALSFDILAAYAGISTEEPALSDINKTPTVGLDVIEPELNVERTVNNWVVCAQSLDAEGLVIAHEQSATKTDLILTDLESKKRCGKFAEMQVVLEKALFVSWSASGKRARAYKARVQFETAGKWASGFVISGIE